MILGEPFEHAEKKRREHRGTRHIPWLGILAAQEFARVNGLGSTIMREGFGDMPAFAFAIAVRNVRAEASDVDDRSLEGDGDIAT
jgi:hypothetical protein